MYLKYIVHGLEIRLMISEVYINENANQWLQRNYEISTLILEMT